LINIVDKHRQVVAKLLFFEVQNKAFVDGLNCINTKLNVTKLAQLSRY